MNKKEKQYFIDNIRINHHIYSHDNKLEYLMNYQIIKLFNDLKLINKKTYDKLIALIYDGAYNHSTYSITSAINLLTIESGLLKKGRC